MFDLSYGLMLSQITSTLIMVGVIWMVQCVHYPAFAYMDRDRFPAFHRLHMERISWIVMPTMLVEFVGAVLLCIPRFSDDPVLWMALNMTLVVLIWLSTFLWSVPIHHQLSHKGFDEDAIVRLCNTNWPRTILWSCKAMILIYLFL
ncbi:MAG: hypothetical protein R3A11_07935 [Bdellovibrionota bacterium]